MKLSMRRASLAERYLATSKSFTSPAILLLRREASNRVTRVTPDLPARTLSQASWTAFPTGLMMPSPVTTTLRRCTVTEAPSARSGLGVRLHVVDGLLDGGDLLGVLVGNLGLELLFERHHQFDGIERIRAQIVDEGRFGLDLGFVHAELLGNDFFDPLFDVFHAVLLPCS